MPTMKMMNSAAEPMAPIRPAEVAGGEAAEREAVLLARVQRLESILLGFIENLARTQQRLAELEKAITPPARRVNSGLPSHSMGIDDRCISCGATAYSLAVGQASPYCCPNGLTSHP